MKTSNQIQQFHNEEFGSLDILMIDGKAYFPATECAIALGYTKPHNAITRHCRYSLKRGVPHPQNKNKTIEVNFIPEGDLYRLIIRSKLPAAERFEMWVFDEVLPTIRKHGAYVTHDTLDELLRSPRFAGGTRHRNGAQGAVLRFDPAMQKHHTDQPDRQGLRLRRGQL